MKLIKLQKLNILQLGQKFIFHNIPNFLKGTFNRLYQYSTQHSMFSFDYSRVPAVNMPHCFRMVLSLQVVLAAFFVRFTLLIEISILSFENRNCLQTNFSRDIIRCKIYPSYPLHNINIFLFSNFV